MKVALEGFGFEVGTDVKVVIGDSVGNELRISAYEALELMDLLVQNAKTLEQVKDDEKKKKRRSK